LFKKIALAATLSLAVSSAHAGTRDLSYLTPTAKSQFFVALHFYKNNCSVLAPAAEEMYHQLNELPLSAVDQVELKKLATPLALLTKVATDEVRADTCNKVEPSVKQMTAYAEALPAAPTIADSLKLENSK
jgi:hypothetical protein